MRRRVTIPVLVLVGLCVLIGWRASNRGAGQNGGAGKAAESGDLSPTGVPAKSDSRPRKLQQKLPPAKEVNRFAGPITRDRERMLTVLLGKYPIRNLDIRMDRKGYTEEELLQIFPFLRKEDGGIDRETMQKLKEMAERELNAYQRMMLLSSTGSTDPAVRAERNKWQSEMSAVGNELYEFANGIEYPGLRAPMATLPAPQLTAVEPGFADFNTVDMQALLNMMALMQSYAERTGNLDIFAQELVDSEILKRRKLVLTLEQAKKLLGMPLDQMATAKY